MRDNLDLRCGSNFYLVGVLHRNEVWGGYILLVLGNGWIFLGIWDIPTFCPYMVLSRDVMALMGV